MDVIGRPVALITGGSRGIGAATALALAGHGYDVIITYRNKEARANEVIAQLTQRRVRGLALRCDVTQQAELAQLFNTVKAWNGHLDIVVLNASGGLERDLVAADPQYPMRINRDAQLALLDGALPIMPHGSTLVFITSHWAHLYGQVEQIPAYTPIAETKYAGEQALRARQKELDDQGIRLIVVTGDLIEGTITPRLLERSSPNGIGQWRNKRELLPTATEMGVAIADAATDTTLPSGSTVVVGRTLESLLQ